MKELTNEDLYLEFLPESHRKIFKVESIIKKETEYNIKAVEKIDRYPQKLLNQSMRKNKPIVSNGYCRRIEVVTFPFNERIVYIHYYRRRWKLEGETESYHNKEELHQKGMKCTKEFGNFLKELTGQKLSKFFSTFPHIRHIKEEDFSMVSGGSKWFHFGRKSNKTS